MSIRKAGDADMTHGAIWKQILAFSLPTGIGMLFQQFYNTVDAVIVGHFIGDSALAAVGSTGSIINMMVCLGTGLSAGAGIAISQAYGAHDHVKLRHAVHTSITLNLILSVILSVLGTVLAPQMLTLMKTPADVMENATTYLSVYFMGVTGLLLYNMGAGILRAVGDSRRPLYFLCVSAILNTIGDVLFVAVFDWGIAGVAIATILAQAISAVLCMIVLMRTDAAYGLRLRSLGIRKDMLKIIVALGLPSSIQMVVTSFSNVFVQAYINVFEKDCMAGWAAFNRIDAFALLPVQAIAMAAATFVGQNYGAKQYKRAREGVSLCVRGCLLITAVLLALIMIFQRPLLGIFALENESLAYGMKFVTIISPFYLTVCFNQIYASALRGIGSAKTPMITMLASFVAFRQLFLFVNSLLGGSFIGTALAYPAGWVMASILISIAYRRCKLFSEAEVPAAADASL